MQRGEKVAMAANLLLDVSREVQKQAKGSFEKDELYAKEFCTIRIGGGRRSGHDYAAARIIRDNFKTVLYISPSPMMKQIAERENVAGLKGSLIANIFSNPGYIDVIYAVSAQLDNERYDGISVDAVILNPGTYLENKGIDVYKRTLPMMRSNEFMHWIYIG